MNRNLHSPTKLTEFARDFDVEPETIFTKFVNKISNAYNSGYNSVNEVQSTSHESGIISGTALTSSLQKSKTTTAKSQKNNHVREHHNGDEASTSKNVTDEKSINVPTSNDSTSNYSCDKPEELPIDENAERTPFSVIQRISNLMAMRNNNLTSYRDTELQRFWMPDSKSKECYECSQKFSTFRRKHHCRLCGQIFCSKCCNQAVPGKIINCSGELKVCTYCSKIVLTYLKSSDINSDLKSDLQALQNDLSNKLLLNDELNQNVIEQPRLQRKISVGYQEERLLSNPKLGGLSNADRKNILQQSNSLKTLFDEMTKGLPNQNRGLDLITYFITNKKSSNKIQAIAILNAMIEAGFLVTTTEYLDSDESISSEFNENSNYKLLRIQDVMTSSGSFQLDLDVDKNSVYLSRPEQQNSSSDSLTEDVILLPNTDTSFGVNSGKDFELQNSLLSSTGSKSLLEAYCDHEEALLTQMLRNENLDQSWSKILLPICARIANTLRPELCGMDLMDIRNFVNFKKVPGGSRNESTIISGVAFSKNVVHRDMATDIENPKILLLQCAIVYQRVEGKFVSIETLLLQENEYLRNVTARILSLKPNVVIVHKNVAGVAQDMLRNHGITLVLDCKLTILERLARCLKCDIVTSIDSNIGRPKLGTCNRFYIRNFNDLAGISKTLMFFEISMSPRGYCVLLRGGRNNELLKVKKVASLLLFARYNWRLELSFLLDEFARPPSPKPNIFDSKETSPLKNESIIIGNTITECENNQLINDNNKKDPKKCEKRNDEIIVIKENVKDFSDPLRATNLSPSIFESNTSVEFAVETPFDNRFRTALSSTVLSISPFVVFPLPFLETEQGRKCNLRSFFPNELYYSKQWSENIEKPTQNEIIAAKNDSLHMLLPMHEFLTHKITTSIDNRDLQTLLANFRANGGRLPKTRTMKIKTRNPEHINQLVSKSDEDVLNKDALDLENHQRLPVLFCSYYHNPKAPSSFCAHPSLLNMKFYGQNDIMLGQFLERYCFRSYICPSCNLPMLDHVRRYVHSLGCVNVKLSEDLTTKDLRQILMTSWCSVCHEMTPSVPMSKDTWCLSFAKYLELRFHAHAYKRRTVDMAETNDNTLQSLEAERGKKQCPHSLHRDHVQYFSYNGIVASFMYTTIDVWEIDMPSLILEINSSVAINSKQILEEIKIITFKGYEVYGKIQEKLAQITGDNELSTLPTLKQILQRDQLHFKENVTLIQTLLTEKVINGYDINDALYMIKKILVDSIDQWQPRLHEAANQSRALSSITKTENQAITIDSGTICTEDLQPEIDSPMSQQSEDDNNLDIETVLPSQSSHDDTIKKSDEIIGPDELNISSKQLHEFDKTASISSNSNTTKDLTDKKSVKTLFRELLPTDKINCTVSSPISLNEHVTLPIGKFPVLVHDQDLSSIIAYSLVSNEYKRALEIHSCGYISDSSNSPNAKRKSQDGFTTDSDEKDNDKKSKSLHLEINFSDALTHFTCKIYFAREFDTMRINFLKPLKQQPIGSQINSQYQEQNDLEKTLLIEENKKKIQRMQSQPELDQKNMKEFENIDRKLSSCSLTPPNTTMTISTTNIIAAGCNSNGRTLDVTKEQEIEDIRMAFVRSICKSIKWEARGGKSGSKFCKTLDDRFVLKEMSKQDVTIFENFAPNYFVHFNKCLQARQPTLLAKIFGVFKITVKKKDSVLEKSLLIMENLFYDCEITNKFDLKGSNRNRLVDPNNQNGEIVLLDENLIQMSWSKPLYILSHSKTILCEAINRDASFLEKNDVMDYSLLVGLNSKNKLLILGIIDYIRTFTLDKRLESIVKQMGGQGKLPTVISPRLYRQRFSEAMERYFLSVPDLWDGLAKQ